MSTHQNPKTSPSATITAPYQLSKSSEIIANNDDLLVQILVKLPLKSLIKFKSVSKHWQSLISDVPFPSSVSGLFLDSLSVNNRKYDFVDLNESNPSSNAPTRSLTFNNNPSGLRIIQSCNGLLLCKSNHSSSFMDLDPNENYYVYNPTTNNYTVLPPLSSRSIRGLNLAFDPSKSPHYKVLCVWSGHNIGDNFHFETYSSKTRTWRISGNSVDAHNYAEFQNGVFCNGAVHWRDKLLQPFLYFNVDEEQLSQMPSPPPPQHWNVEQNYFRYFGESSGHLHLIYEIYNRGTPHLHVYEMEMDYSGWFVKYRIDCSQFSTAFPEIISRRLKFQNVNYYFYSIVYLVRGDVDEESCAVIRIPGKVIRYNFKSKTFHKLCHIEAGRELESCGFLPGWSSTHECIESLALV
ncbi:hypothetical protein UlMin_026398 [Ulmus minor]